VIAPLAIASLGRRPLRTFLTTLGIAVAIGSTVIFLSLGEGLRRAFAQELRALGPDLQVSYGPFEGTMFTAVPELPLAYEERLREVADQYGITEVTPMLVSVRGSLAAGSAFVFYGIPAEIGAQALYPTYRITTGRGLATEAPSALEAVIGTQVAHRERLGVGDVLRFNPRAQFTIVGVATVDGGLLDNAVVVPLEALQEATGTSDRVSYMALSLARPDAAAQVAEALAERYPELGFQTRGDISSIFDRSLRISDVVRLGISTIALVVGAIAVANTMLMSVFERTREFGVVRAVGARPRFLFGLVLVEALLLAFAGAVLGVGLGFLGAWVVNAYAVDLTGIEVAAVTARLVAFAVLVAAVMGVVAGLLPAARAAQIQIAVAVARE
jgi:putative ABC transport system permease protein